MKRKIAIFIAFAIISLLAMGSTDDVYPFLTLNSIMLPIYNNKIVFYNLCLNYSIIMIAIYSLVNNCNAIFEMNCFIFARSNKEKLLILYIKSMFKKIFTLIMIKLLADLLTNNINGLTNLGMLLKIYTSTFLSFALWGEIIYMLFLMTKSEKKSMFIIISLTFISQFLALKCNIFGVIAITWFSFYYNFECIIIYKIVTIIILSIFTIFLTRKNEFIGGMKND